MASDSVDTPKPDETPTQPEATNPPSLQSDSTSDVEVKPETKDQPPSEENTESSETKNTLSTDDISKLPRELGTVKWFNVKAGYGFIMRASGEDIFIHQTAIINNNPSKSERSVREGEEVEYIVIRGVKGPEVAEVTGPGLVAVLGSDYARNKGDYKGRAMGRQSRVRSYQNRGRNPMPSYRAPPRSGQRQMAPREPYHYQQFSSYPPRNGFRDYPEPMYRDRPYVEHYRDQYRDRERDNVNYRERDAQYRDPGYDPTGPRPARNFYSRRITRPIEGDRDREREPGRERDVERDRDPRRRRMPRFDGDREYREKPLDGNTRGEGMERERTRGEGVERERPRGEGVERERPRGEGVERERPRGEGVERERPRGSRENRTRGTRSGKQYPRRKPKRTEDREEKDAGELSPVSSDHNVNSLNDELADLQINGEPDSSEQHNGESAPIVDVKRVEPLASDAPESGSVEA